MLTFGTVYRVITINGQAPQYWDNFSPKGKTKKIEQPEEESILGKAARILAIANGVNGYNCDAFTVKKDDTQEGDVFISMDGPDDRDGYKTRSALLMRSEQKLSESAQKATDSIRINTNPTNPTISTITKESGELLWDARWVPAFNK
jgi:hypothetical protein